MSLNGRQKRQQAAAHNERYEREKQRPPVRALFRYLWWLANHDAAERRESRRKIAAPLAAVMAASLGTVGHVGDYIGIRNFGGESDHG